MEAASTLVGHSRLSFAVSLKFCCLVGGSVGLLALNALFVLMKDYNLFVKLLSLGQLVSELVYIVTIHPFIPDSTLSSTVTYFMSSIVPDSSA